MIGGTKPYAKMKNCEVWLGAVPSHWLLRRMKTVLRERSEKGFPGEPLLAATQSRGVVRKDQYEIRTVLALKDLHLLKLVRVGDFVISLRSFQGGIEFAREQGIISPAYTVLYPTQSHMHDFLAWLFKSKPYVENLSLFVTGIRQGQNIDFEKLSRSELPIPPADEQVAIVQFLDHADRRIRRAIAAKQKLVKLLEEQKQAIIHHAVTRGLDPNVRLKPSGVEWLDDVPEHWAGMRLKHVAEVQTGITLGKTYPKVELVERPYLRVANVQAGHLKLANVTYVQVPQSEANRSTLRIGDVLMTEGGDIDKLGRGCVWRGEVDECLHQNHVFAVRPSMTKLLPEFLEVLLGSQYGRTYFQITAKQTTNLAATNGTTVGNFPLLLPRIGEQQRILNWLKKRTMPLADASVRAGQEISLLREYRTRLIADVVTGKLDVREAAARLPDEVEATKADLDEGLVERENEIDDEGELADTEYIAA